VSNERVTLAYRVRGCGTPARLEESIYRTVAEGKMRAAQIGGKRALRFLPEWVDAYAGATAAVIEVCHG
jgi:hypothetical protein